MTYPFYSRDQCVLWVFFESWEARASRWVQVTTMFGMNIVSMEVRLISVSQWLALSLVWEPDVCAEYLKITACKIQCVVA